MSELKDVMKIAKDFIIEINGEKENFQVEEIALSPDKNKWEVTYSYDSKIENPNQLQPTLGFEKKKDYKRVVIDKETREVLGMYNWSYENLKVA